MSKNYTVFVENHNLWRFVCIQWYYMFINIWFSFPFLLVIYLFWKYLLLGIYFVSETSHWFEHSSLRIQFKLKPCIIFISHTSFVNHDYLWFPNFNHQTDLFSINIWPTSIKRFQNGTAWRTCRVNVKAITYTDVGVTPDIVVLKICLRVFC